MFGPPAPRLRRMGVQDLDFVVGAHLSHFPRGVAAQLGPRFLARYYRTHLDVGPAACAFVAEVDGHRAGYLVGLLDGPTHRQLSVRHHGVALTLAGIGGALRRPRTGLHLLRTRARRYASALRRHALAASGSRAPGGKKGRTAVLSYVIVTSRQRGAGIGSCLVERFEAEAREAGCVDARLVTEVAEDGVGSWYERRGWERMPGEVEADGRRIARFRKDLRTL